MATRSAAELMRCAGPALRHPGLVRLCLNLPSPNAVSRQARRDGWPNRQVGAGIALAQLGRDHPDAFQLFLVQHGLARPQDGSEHAQKGSGFMGKFSWPEIGDTRVTFACVCNHRKPADLQVVDMREGRRAVLISGALDEAGRKDGAKDLVLRIAQTMSGRPEYEFDAQQWGCAAFAVRIHCPEKNELFCELLRKTLRKAALTAFTWEFVTQVYPGVMESPSLAVLLDYLADVFQPDELRALWREVIVLRLRHEADAKVVPSGWRETTTAFWRDLTIRGVSLEAVGRDAEREGCLWRLLRSAEHDGQYGIAAALATAMELASEEVERLTQLAQEHRQSVSLTRQAEALAEAAS